MSDLKWTILDSTYISNHRYFTARRDRCETPSGKIIPEYFVVELPPSVCILPVTAEGDVVMVRQYRHPLGEVILEIPGGFLDPGEDPGEAAARELLEETGYAFDQFIPLGKTAANPGVLNNYTYLYLATGGRKVQEQQLDPNEEIDIVKVPFKEVVEMVKQGQLVQSMHTNCVWLAMAHLGI
jgi:ADP-ribose pyrophosphatase